MTLRDRLAHYARSDVVAAAFILAVLLNASFFPYLWGGKTLLSSASDAASLYSYGAAPVPPEGVGAFKVVDPGAPGWQTEPDFAQIHHQLFVEKRLPLWNPAIGYGEPLAADMQSQPYFPLSIIAVLHPSSTAYNWWCVARLFVAGLGAFCFLRLFTSFWPSVAAGVSLMFAGYYLIFYDIPHLSVETLVPWLFYVNERLVRAPRFPQILAASIAGVLVYLGGMPESQLLVLSYAYVYAVYRVLTDGTLRPNALRVAGALVVEGAAGAGGAAFLLLPFVEYTRISLDQHQAANIGGAVVGLGHDGKLLQALTYAVPLIFGPPWENVTTNLSGFAGIRGFFGITAIYLALVALFGALGDRGRRQDPWTRIVPFFFFAACFFVLKRFGSELVNWVGALPGFSLVGFTKYEEPLLGFAIAALAGFGVARIAETRSSGVIRWWAGTLSLGILTGIYAIVHVVVTPTMVGRGYTVFSLLGAIVVLALALVASALPAFTKGTRARTGAIAAIVAVLAIEATGDYLIPIHYFINAPPSAALDPYRGAPFVSFLTQATRDSRERIIGQDDLLYPNWAGAFDLADVRDLDAMYDKRYLPFVRALLDPKGIDPGLRDRFTGALELDLPSQLRFLSLSSVGYVTTSHALDSNDSFFSAAYRQNITQLPDLEKSRLQSKRYVIGGVEREGLLEHPPFARLPLRVKIPAHARQLTFGIGMDPAVYADGVAICGAGAAFTLELRDGARVTRLFGRYIDPKHVLSERRWIDTQVNVAPWAGKTVDLLLSTAPGPQGNVCADWAVWGGGQFTPARVVQRAPSPFTLVFRDGNTLVYRFDHPLPRVSIYESAKSTPTSEDALTVLSDPAFDISRSVVVTTQEPGDIVQLPGTNGVPSRVRAGVIAAYDSQDVRAHVTVVRRSVVVLNDTDYPGWNAYIDGKPAPMLRANALFRGVVVEPGEHDVEFKYEPESFKLGVLISLLTVVAGIAGGVLSRRRRRDVGLAVAA